MTRRLPAFGIATLLPSGYQASAQAAETHAAEIDLESVAGPEAIARALRASLTSSVSYEDAIAQERRRAVWVVE